MEGGKPSYRKLTLSWGSINFNTVNIHCTVGIIPATWGIIHQSIRMTFVKSKLSWQVFSEKAVLVIFNLQKCFGQPLCLRPIESQGKLSCLHKLVEGLLACMMCYSGKCSADDASIIHDVRLLLAPLRKNGSHNPRQVDVRNKRQACPL